MLLLLGKWEALLQALCSEAAAAAGEANPAFGGTNTAFQWILNRKIKKKKSTFRSFLAGLSPAGIYVQQSLGCCSGVKSGELLLSETKE